MLIKVAAKDTETVVNALIRHVRRLPHELYKSLTWDRGKEMAAHSRFTLATDIQVFLRSTESLAAWNQRKYQWPPQAISAKGPRPQRLLAEQTRCYC
jgi:IS30 family transposase